MYEKKRKVSKKQSESKISLLNKNNKVELRLKKKRKFDKILEELENKSKRHCNFDNNSKKTDQIFDINKLSSSSDNDIPNDESLSILKVYESNNNPDNGNSIREVSLTKDKKQKNQNSDDKESNVIYLGRIPHGFYESEMKSYFKQFGTVTRIKLSRNKKTGKSKHYAFIEFESAKIARIVAKTMNNYLLFGHILKCSVIPQNKIHKSMFIGSNKQFRPIPWSKIIKKRYEEPKTKKQWIKLQKRNDSRLRKKMLLLKKLEINYEYQKDKVNR
ncbi:unnamed protein product [Pneumocystis jirovecii]|uniref:RRM domain-containing protein n=1 Tax=Pneumocystis jirovecii TaxID=42068 RepID=L0P9B0_PNEJI|nr:unnamed protein product [Pneumocystis jirovecii]